MNAQAKRNALVFLLVLAIAGYFGWDTWSKWQAEKTLGASGTIQTTEIGVGSRVGGRILKVLVKEGDMVKVGQPLVQLDPYQIPSQKQALEAELAQAQARLQELINGARPQEIQAAQAQYAAAKAQASLAQAGARSEEIQQAQASRKQAEADLENASRNYQRFQSLLSRRVISQQEFDSTQTSYQVAQERVNAARERENELRRGNRPQEITAAREQAQAQLAQLNLLKAGSRTEDIAAQRAMVDSIQAQIRQLDVSSDELTVSSSCDCQVSSLDLKPGQLVLPNQPLGSLVNLNDLWVRVYIPEEKFGKVHPGDKAEVHVDPYPKTTFSGTVLQLASKAEFTPRNVQTQESRKMQVFGIKVGLDNKKGLLRPGMPADVTFDVSNRRP